MAGFVIFFFPIVMNLRNVSLSFVHFDFVNLSRPCRMDDAEACFILSSRNEVDRMAAVRSTATLCNNNLSLVMSCDSFVYRNSSY